MMSVCRVLLRLVLLVAVASASHFWGGTMSFLPKGRNPDGSYRVDFRYKDVYDSCGSRLNWACASGNCGGQTAVEIGTIYRNLDWCQEEGIVTRQLISDKPFQLSASTCCWVSIINGGGNYRMHLPVMVDLGRRSDTNEPNHSPHTTIISFVRVPKNCPRTYNFIGCDPDHDDIKCRNAVSLPTGFHIEQDTCNLHYYPTASTGMYAIELEVEDYPKQYTTLTYHDGSTSHRTPFQPSSTASPVSTTAPSGSSPFSRLPLQFVVKVEFAVPTCSAGVYLPQFLHPTPADRERLHTAINKELEIRIRASASHSVIQDLIITGPLNITKTKTLTGEFVVTWTPRSDDDGEHFPICFIAESKSGSTLYQSEMRCVIVEVKPDQATIGNVICAENFMAIEVNKSEITPGKINNIHEGHLRLNDPSCTLYSNDTHVFANMSLNTCGTVMEEDETNVVFKNEIVSVDNPNDIITRHHQVEIQFFCKYPKKGSVTFEFDAHRSASVFVQKGFGTFSYQFEFFQSSQFRNLQDPSTYPLEYDLGEMMYMQIEGTSPVNNTEVFVESCKASPSDDPNSHISYSIISNGCIQDETLQFFSNHDNVVKFGMKAFKFIGLHDQVPTTAIAKGDTHSALLN